MKQIRIYGSSDGRGAKTRLKIAAAVLRKMVGP